MTVLTIPDEHRLLTDAAEIKTYLASIEIEYERWPITEIAEHAPPEWIFKVYAREIEELKARGYRTVDLIDVDENTPGLDAMLARFDKEHTHDEDEVRYTVAGRGIFHIRPSHGPIIAIEVSRGDLIRVPRGTFHWFNLCSERRIRALRFFLQESGWIPAYSQTGVDRHYNPVCFGPAHISLREH